MARKSNSRSNQTREEMIEHAASVFAKGEFHRTKTCDLAVPGKFSEGRYYTHFGTKDGLLKAIFHEYWRKMYVRTEERCVIKLDPVTRVRVMIQVAIEIFRDHEHLFRVTSVNSYPPEQMPEPPGADYHAKYRNLALRLIAHAVKDLHNENPDVDARLIYLSLLGALEYCLNEIYRNRHFGRKRTRNQIAIGMIERHLQFLLNGFLGAQSKRRPNMATPTAPVIREAKEPPFSNKPWERPPGAEKFGGPRGRRPNGRRGVFCRGTFKGDRGEGVGKSFQIKRTYDLGVHDSGEQEGDGLNFGQHDEG